MSKFLLFVLLGIAAVAVWGWLRWHRHSKKPATESPSPISPRTAEQKSVEPPDDAVAETPQTLGRDTPMRDVSSVNADAFSTESSLSDTRQQIPSPDSSLVLPDQVSTPSEMSDSEDFPKRQSPEQEADTLSPGGDWNELEEAAITQEQPAVTEAKTTTLSSGAGCKSNEADKPQDKTSEGTIQTALQPDAATDTHPALAAPPHTPANDIATKPAADAAPEVVPTTKRRNYLGLRPPSPTLPTKKRVKSELLPPPPSIVTLRFRVQLIFDRGGGIKTLAFVPYRCEGTPDDLEVIGTQGELRLTKLRDNCYEPIPLDDAGDTLQESVEWRDRSEVPRWCWVLAKREIYVLAPGDEFGLSGFVSTECLWLNARHVVLAKADLRNRVLAALAEAGCAAPKISDDTMPGMPSGWLLFRDVTPTRPVPRREEDAFLNALCPLPNIKPEFVGGIRLQARTWLAGFPPRIRFTGKLESDVRVMIDGHLAGSMSDGAFESPGWDDIGEHRLWFGDRTVAYELRQMDENWEQWHAYNFGTGVSICGPIIHHVDGARWRQVRVPVGNLLLVGAQPGEIFHCPMRADTRCSVLIVLAPFNPVWALPFDPAHADKRTARIVLLYSTEPITSAKLTSGKPVVNRALRAWVTAINDAGRKRLALATESDGVKNLWRRYRAVAKQLWRKTR